MPNKNPKNHHTRFQQQNPVPLAKQSLTVRLPEEIDSQIRSLPDRSEKLRAWILEGWLRYQAGQEDSDPVQSETNFSRAGGENPKP